MNTKNLETLKIHKLTQAQYDRELAAGNIDENALYLTPDDNVISTNMMVVTGTVADEADPTFTADSYYDLTTDKTYEEVLEHVNNGGYVVFYLKESQQWYALDKYYGNEVARGESYSFIFKNIYVDYINPNDLVRNVVSEPAICTAIIAIDSKGRSYYYNDAKLLNYKSDWNVNEEYDPAFVKNRPFYTTDPVETTLVEETSVEVSDTSQVYTISSNLTLVDGQTYKVTFNGTEYECVASATDYGAIFIGNGSKFDVSSGNNEPFFCFVNSDGNSECYLATSETGTFTIKIIEMKSIDIQLPEKYISYKPGLKVEGKVYTIYGEEVIAEKGAEVFNDYADNIASGEYSHAEGEYSKASGTSSHAEGISTEASGSYSHAEGCNTGAYGYASHAEGDQTTASGHSSHAEGTFTTAYGSSSHAEGYYNRAMTQYQHVQGKYNKYEEIDTYKISNYYTTTIDIPTEEFLSGDSYTFDPETGYITITNPITTTEPVVGKYILLDTTKNGNTKTVYKITSITDTELRVKYYYTDTNDTVNGKYAHIVGNGTAENKRSNAHTLAWDGTAEYQGDVIAYGCESGQTPISLKELDKTKTMIVTLSVAQPATASEDPEIDPLIIPPNYVADKTFDEIYQHVTNGGYALVKNPLASGYYGPGMPTYYNLEAIEESAILFSYTYMDTPVRTPVGTYAERSNNSIVKISAIITSDNNIAIQRQTYDLTITEERRLGTTAKTVVGAINEVNERALQLSIPNLLINGDFRVWQRGKTISNVDGTKYTADRWQWNNSVSGGIIVAKVDGIDGMYVECKSSCYCELTYKIEDKSALLNKHLTLSFYSTKEGVGEQFGTVRLTSENDYIILTNAGVVVETGTNPNLLFMWGVNLTAGEKFNITNIKLEPGSIATPFVPRPYGEELALCKRYYQLHSEVMFAKSTSDTYFWGSNLSVEMRVDPTLEKYMLYTSSANDVTSSFGSCTVWNRMLYLIILKSPISDSVLRCSLWLDAEIY